MDLEMVLNELSLEPPADNVQIARQRMSNLVSTMSTATRLGVKRVLRTHDDLSYILLAPDYPLIRWRNDNLVDRETRLFFKTLLTKAPFLTDIVNIVVEDSVGRSQFSYQGNEAKGLGVAFLLEALALSLKSELRWNSSRLELTVIELDDDGELGDEQRIEVTHACSIEHVLEHEGWIKERIYKATQIAVRDGADLWARRMEFFPNLQFCGTVQKDLQQVLHGHLMLLSIVEKLSALESFCKDWHDGPFDAQQIACKTTPESVATLEQFAQEHTFRCPDGQSRIFSWHVRLTPGAWRIYFYPEEEKRQLIIGYVGQHLSTKLYPT